MNDVIEFVEHRTHTNWIMLDAYEFMPKGRMRWLQRQAWRFLHWCGALNQAREPTFEVAKHRIEADSVIECLLKQRRALFDHIRREGQTLLIGAEDYRELMTGAEIKHFVSFDAKLGYNTQIIGLKIQVVPWMRGMVVMP